MIKKMKREEINQLLTRYWACETTLREEEALRDYFSRDDLPETLQQYRPLFRHVNAEQSVTLSHDFDQRLEMAIAQAGRKRYVTIRIFAPLLRIAASLLLIGGVAISLFFISRQQNRPGYAGNTGNSNIAMEQATLALEKLSYALQASERASLETLQTLDELDIDWSRLDSLNSTPTHNSESSNKEESL